MVASAHREPPPFPLSTHHHILQSTRERTSMHHLCRLKKKVDVYNRFKSSSIMGQTNLYPPHASAQVGEPTRRSRIGNPY